MVQSEDGKWRSMANEGLYARQKLIGMLYRNELAAGLTRLGYGIEKTHADGRFEIAGVSREAVEAFSPRPFGDILRIRLILLRNYNKLRDVK